MSKLLKLQLRNIFKSKAYYVCSILTILLSPVLSFLMSLGSKDNSILAFPKLEELLHGEIGIVSILFIVIICCMDYSEMTTKNIIARGYTRMQYLLTKIFSLIISLFIVYVVSTFIILILFGGNGIGFTTELGYKVILDIVNIIAFVVLYSTISILIEKTSTAVITCLLAPSIITTVLGLADSKFNLDIGKYWIDNLNSTFSNSISLSNLGLITIYYLIYIVIILFIGKKLLNKKEIK